MAMRQTGGQPRSTVRQHRLTWVKANSEELRVSAMTRRTMMIWNARLARTSVVGNRGLHCEGQLDSSCRMQWPYMTTDAPVQYRQSVLSMSRCLALSGFQE